MVIRAMRRHPSKGALQRQACLAVRNIAARSPALRDELLGAGVEGVLRDAGKLQGAVDEAYAALRDLGCEVQFVKVSSDGQVAAAYEEFGGGQKKLNFNPDFDTSNNISDRVSEEAHAPFPNCDAYDGHDHGHDHGHQH